MASDSEYSSGGDTHHSQTPSLRRPKKAKVQQKQQRAERLLNIRIVGPVKYRVSRVTNKADQLLKTGLQITYTLSQLTPEMDGHQETLKTAGTALLDMKRAVRKLTSLYSDVDVNFNDPSMNASPLKERYLVEVYTLIAKANPHVLAKQLHTMIFSLEEQLRQLGYPLTSYVLSDDCKSESVDAMKHHIKLTCENNGFSNKPLITPKLPSNLPYNLEQTRQTPEMEEEAAGNAYPEETHNELPPLAYVKDSLPRRYIDPITGKALEGFYAPGTAGPDLRMFHRTFPLQTPEKTKCQVCEGAHNVIRPNDVLASGENSFFISNDGGSCAWKIANILEIATGFHQGSLVHFDGKTSKYLIQNTATNGIILSKDKQTLYVSFIYKETIGAFQWNIKSQEIQKISEIDVLSACDNFHIDEEDNLWSACHPVLKEAAVHLGDHHNPALRSPTQVLRFKFSPDKKSAEIVEVFSDDGRFTSAGAVAANFDKGKQMLIGTVFRDVTHCDIDISLDF
ncbi:hypothetical protein CAEBREN_15858 [Caenorhabditis brenneri]|uniref:SMP-30/Gluconolactonase/LRE-like region domain-containing protein n=1 Tax=Caenorhabditis brenneri TaxID=135651 RepID=G0M9P9_CAEBE|nr:hypothetical protein CAEBREN_15858 [Caenorhabditis brenneri]